ncbi:UNVERIFIED_CONTAM: hypothetical protein PYX00_000668 [Menopon gallinae]|uniref:Uncharacterized protein n=1 Tax=Menopon gallinae TaxID=328185 RepID=A0AAW2IBA2_9NEOP
MSLKFVSLILFVAYQANPISSQQQGINPAQIFPWGRPFYAAAADAWREYFIRAQQATNQMYQQWANLTGNTLNNGIGGLYNQQQRPPLQGIFRPNVQNGLQLSELLPPGEAATAAPPQAPMQDPIPATAAPVRPQVQQQQQKPQQQQQQQAVPQPQVQQQPAPQPQTQQIPPSQAQQVPPPQSQLAPPSPPVQQQQQQQATGSQAQLPGRPLQALGQATGTGGIFAASNPLGWMG